MQRKLLEQRIRKLLNEFAEGVATHTTLAGKIVPYDCKECYNDLIKRLEDAMHYRDTCPRGSADRVHYNGLLGIYRSKIRRHPLHAKQ